MCREEEETDQNHLLQCDGCREFVHMDCYGVPAPPEGRLWLCDVCRLGVLQSQMHINPVRWPVCLSFGSAASGMAVSDGARNMCCKLQERFTSCSTVACILSCSKCIESSLHLCLGFAVLCGQGPVGHLHARCAQWRAAFSGAPPATAGCMRPACCGCQRLL